VIAGAAGFRETGDFGAVVTFVEGGTKGVPSSSSLQDGGGCLGVEEEEGAATFFGEGVGEVEPNSFCSSPSIFLAEEVEEEGGVMTAEEGGRVF
jgi:hypothetical protein